MLTVKFTFFGTLYSCSYLCSQTTKGFYLYGAFNHKGTCSDHHFSWHLATEQRPLWMNMTPCSRPRVHIALPLCMQQHSISSAWILLEEQALKEPRGNSSLWAMHMLQARKQFPTMSCRSPWVSADISHRCSKDYVSGPSPLRTPSRSPGQTCSTSPNAAGMAKTPWKQS